MDKRVQQPQSHVIAQQNLRMAPYVAVIGGLLAGIVAFWVPFSVLYLLVAVGLGACCFLMQWFGVRRRIYLGPLILIFMLVAFQIANHEILPRVIPGAKPLLCGLQFLGVWTFSFGGLQVVFRKKLKREFERTLAEI